MTKFRHVIWMLVAAGGLLFSATQSFAQSSPMSATNRDYRR